MLNEYWLANFEFIISMENTTNLTGLSQTIFTALNTRDFSEFEVIVTDDVELDFPGAGRVEGHKKVLIFMKALLRKYPKLEFTVSEIITGEERAVVVWTNSGEYIDGTPYANSGMTLMYFKDGKITFISDYFKDTSFVR